VYSNACSPWATRGSRAICVCTSCRLGPSMMLITPVTVSRRERFFNHAVLAQLREDAFLLFKVLSDFAAAADASSCGEVHAVPPQDAVVAALHARWPGSRPA
jgi:hypothetical protein